MTLTYIVYYLIIGSILGVTHTVVAPAHRFDKRIGYVSAWIMIWPLILVLSIYLGMQELTEMEK